MFFTDFFVIPKDLKIFFFNKSSLAEKLAAVAGLMWAKVQKPK